MKKYFYSVLAASMLFATSCSQDQEIVDITKGEGQKVTFKVEIPEASQSRAIAVNDKVVEIGKGQLATQLIYAQYEEGTTMNDGQKPLVAGLVTDPEGDGIFTVELTMAKDIDYDVLFMAYNPKNNIFGINENLTEDQAKTIDLRNLQVKSPLLANQEAYDAFVGAMKDKNIKDTDRNVELHRPFAQVNAVVTNKDLVENAYNKLGIEVTHSSFTINNAPNTYNVYNGETKGEVKHNYQIALVMEESGKSGYPNQAIFDATDKQYYLATAYVLAGDDADSDAENLTAEFKFYRGENPETDCVSTLPIPQLPVQRNYRTNVIGELLTKTEAYTITIDAEFGDDDHIVGVWDGTIDENGVEEVDNTYKIYNGSELAWIAEQVDKGVTFKDKTVKLMNNIDLANIAWNPIGKSGDDPGFQGTFDGNDMIISNLYVDLTAEPAYQSAGLFANARYATIKNFTVSNAVVKNLIKTSTADTSCGTAVVLGSAQFPVTIDNVDVINAIVEGNRYVGGIGGYVCGTIENCDVNGISLTATPDNMYQNTYDNGDKVGGILGYHNDIKGESNTTNNNTIEDFTIRAYRDMGGIAGCGRGEFKNNRATNGLITIDQTTNNYGTKDYNAAEIVGRQIEATIDDSNVYNNVAITIYIAVSSAEALTEALGKGVSVILDNDIDFGSTQLAITGENQVVDLGGHALTTANNWGGISLKNGATIKNGTITHAGNTAAIKAFAGSSVENVTINATCATADKTVTGIAVQQGANVESIKNVTINGVSQGIEVGYQATVGLIENAVVNESNNGTAKGIGLVINGGKVGKAKNCTFKGETYGITFHLKGVFDAGLELENCKVEGTTASIYAWDEKGISNTSGSLTLTYDAATTLTGPFVWDFEDECKSVVTLNKPE